MSESASGEAIRVSGGKNKTFSCPKCGASFSTRQGTATHSQKSHNKRLIQYPELTDKKYLYAKYWGEFKTGSEIAEQIGCGVKTVTAALERLGIPRRASQAATNTIKGGLSDREVEIIEGELLGDGSIRTRGNITAPFRLGTSRREYRDWLAALLEGMGFKVRTPNVEHTLDGHGSYDSYRVETWQYPCLYRIGSRWYPNGEKRVPTDFKVTPLNLRHWYIGDGSYGEALNLHTEGFTDECRNKLIQQLAVRGIRATAQASGALHIWRESHERFFGYMAALPPELGDVYGYKWPEEYL